MHRPVTHDEMSRHHVFEGPDDFKGFEVFVADHDGLITEEGVDGKVLGASFAIALICSGGDGIFFREEFECTIDLHDSDRDGIICKAEFYSASHLEFHGDGSFALAEHEFAFDILEFVFYCSSHLKFHRDFYCASHAALNMLDSDRRRFLFRCIENICPGSAVPDKGRNTRSAVPGHLLQHKAESLT